MPLRTDGAAPRLRRLLRIALPLALAFAVLAPLFALVLGSFVIPADGGVRFGLGNHVAAWTAAGGAAALGNSLLYSVGAACAALATGTSMAWLCERTDLPLRRTLAVAMVLPLFMPGMLFSYAWILLASPRIGMLNQWLPGAAGATPPLIDVYGFAGMIWVEGLHTAPMVFLLVTAMLRSVDPNLELAARLAGASLLQTLSRITLPLLAPALGSAFLLVLIRAFGTFEVPAMLGTPVGIEVVSSRIFKALRDHPGDTGPAGAYAAALLLFTMTAMGLHEWLTRSRLAHAANAFGRAPESLLRLGALRPLLAVLAIGVSLAMAGLPLLAIAWSSLLPFLVAPGQPVLGLVTLDGYRQVLGAPAVADAALQTLRLCAFAATVIMAAGLWAAWIVDRTRSRARALVEPLINSALALPGAVLGVAILVFHTMLDTGLYGTSWLLLLAYVTRFLPYGLRYGRSALGQIPPELEMAARCAGAGTLQTLRRITVPLLAPGLLAGWIYVALVSARELASSLLLYSPGNEVLTVVAWQYWEGGQTMQLSALSVLFIAALLLIAGAARLLSWRPRLAR